MDSKNVSSSEVSSLTQGFPLQGEEGKFNQLEIAVNEIATPIFEEYKQVFGDNLAVKGLSEAELQELIHLGKTESEETAETQLKQSYLAEWGKELNSRKGGPLNKIKWLLGLENNLDKTIKAKFEKEFQALKNSKLTSISQLKSHIQAAWHLNKKIDNYNEFKETARNEAQQGIFGQLKFNFLTFVMTKLFGRAAEQISVPDSETLSINTSAEIGQFKAGGKEYKVVARYPLTERTPRSRLERIRSNQPECRDKSLKDIYYSGNGAVIEVLEKKEDGSFKQVTGPGHRDLRLQVSIGREDAEYPTKESYFPQRQKLVLDTSANDDTPVLDKKHLVMDKGFDFMGSTIEEQGSNRELDVKLTQVMVELMKQNDLKYAVVNSYHDDLPVLQGTGFFTPNKEESIIEIKEFSDREGSGLFPPYKDYGGVGVYFDINSTSEATVKRSKEKRESWDEIIQNEPILNPHAAKLPDYILKKPNIVPEKPNIVPE